MTLLEKAQRAYAMPRSVFLSRSTTAKSFARVAVPGVLARVTAICEADYNGRRAAEPHGRIALEEKTVVHIIDMRCRP